MRGWAHPVLWLVVVVVGVGEGKAAEDGVEVVTVVDWPGTLRDVARESAQNVLIERLVEAGAWSVGEGGRGKGRGGAHKSIATEREGAEGSEDVRSLRCPSVAAGCGLMTRRMKACVPWHSRRRNRNAPAAQRLAPGGPAALSHPGMGARYAGH